MITFGLCSLRELAHLVHVDAVVVAAHAVGHRLEPLARHVDRRAVGQMAAGGEIEAQEGVAGLHQRHERRGIGGRAGMRLHVREPAAEQLGNPFDRQRFGDVDVLAAAVIAPARQPFGVFVGQHRALRFEHRPADDVLRRDQLDLVALAAELLADGRPRSPDRPPRATPKTLMLLGFLGLDRLLPWPASCGCAITISAAQRQALAPRQGITAISWANRRFSPAAVRPPARTAPGSGRSPRSGSWRPGRSGPAAPFPAPSFWLRTMIATERVVAALLGVDVARRDEIDLALRCRSSPRTASARRSRACCRRRGDRSAPGSRCRRPAP